MCCRFLRLCVRHIWPGPSGNDWFTSLLSSPSNTFLSHFNLGAAQQAAPFTHTHAHKRASTHTRARARTHRNTLMHICTHTRSTLATVGVHFLVLQRSVFSLSAQRGGPFFIPFFLWAYFSSPSLSLSSLLLCVSLSLSLVSVLLTVENL